MQIAEKRHVPGYEVREYVDKDGFGEVYSALQSLRDITHEVLTGEHPCAG